MVIKEVFYIKMCKIVQKFNNGNLKVTCTKSNKPLSVTNQWGMFCEDLCNLEECKKAEKKINKILDEMDKLFKPGGVAQSG